MKRGLCCVCAVLVCTALAFAGSPARPGVDQKTGQQAVTPTVAPTHQDSVAAFDMAKFTAMGGLSNHAPEGYISPSGTWPSAETGRAHEFECSPAAQPEGEPDCGDDYVDSYNGGCNSTPEAFQPPIGPGPILGTSGTYSVAGQSGYRDTDWYVYVATEPTKITWSATAEFPVLIFLIDGTQGCGGYVSLGGALADPCKTAVIEKCVPAGTYWLWVGPSVYEGVTCGAQYCAQLDVESCVAPDPIACPDDSFPGAWQLVYSEDEAWQLFVSNDHFPDYNPDNGILLYEHFKGLGSPPAAITNVHWWGVSATYNDEGTLVECPLDPGNFHVAFWAHNKVTNRPLYEPAPDCYGGMYAGLPDPPLYEFDVTGENLTKTDTHRVYRILNDDGSAQSEFTLWSWGCNLPVPLTAAEGWLSIQNTDDCPFWWAASPGPPAGTGGVHVQETRIGETVTREDVDGDLSWCITTDSTGPFTGACCDTVAGVCRNTTSDDCVGNYEEWHGSQTCSQIQCPAEVWACCEGSPANCSMYELANCTGDWYRFYVCSSTDPGYDPNFFCNGVDNIIDCPEIAPYCSITCDSPSAFSRGLTGGYLYISWDRGPGDQRYVIDNFTGFTGSINRMKWWGNSTTVWDGPDCDFDNPAPFAVKFYHTSGSGPDYNNPAKSYDPIDVPYTDTGYVWTGSPEYGSIDCYIISLPSTYSPGSGTQWVSIASKSPDCDYIWAPGSDGGTGQWFYDNGTCGPEPGARHRCFCLHTNLRTGACCDELTGTCTNSQQEPACLSAGGTFYPSKGCNQIPAPGCIAHTGACCDHTTGGCEITASAGCTGTGLWLGKDTTCDQCCVVMCPPGATPEGEETCYDGYVDEYNMGCFTESGWSSDDFVVINDGETICGETGTFYATVGGTDGRRDLDFYRYELTDPCAVVQAKVNGEFQPDVWLMVGQCYTDTWCGQEQTYVLVYSQAAASPCGDAIASAPLTGPNIYYIMVSCYGAVGDVPCGTPYTLEIDKAPAGHCTIGEDSGLTSEAFCLALGGTWLDDCTPSETQKGDSNCDGSVNSFDIDPFVLALTDPEAWSAAYTCNYLDANDCNEDGVVNAFDIDPFVQCLTGGCK